MTTQELIAEAISLPVEKRALLAESILRSLNSPETDIDDQWAAVVRRRLTEVREGRAQTIPGEEVFAKIRKRFGK